MNLPGGYSYYTLNEDIETGLHMFRVKQIVDDKSAKIWLEKFSLCTNTYWRISRTYPYAHRINLYKIDYRCIHNTDRRAKGIKQSRHTGCPAALRIVVKRYVKNSRAAIPDILAKDFPGLVVLKHRHNHGDILHAGKDFPCAICPKKFSTLGSATRHMNQTHDTTILPSTNLRCIDCKNSTCFPSVKSFRFHLANKHKYSMEEEHFSFQSRKAFELWKKDIEDRTDSLYVKQRRAKTSFPLKKECFRCHRSAPFYYKDPRKSFRTNDDSKKLGFYCPSAITAVDYETHVKVCYIRQHYMHANDKEHNSLDEEEKSAISLKLQAAAALTEISNDFSNYSNGEIYTKIFRAEEENYNEYNSSADIMDDSQITNDDNENSFLSEDVSQLVQVDILDVDSTQNSIKELLPENECADEEDNDGVSNCSNSDNFECQVFNGPINVPNLKTEPCFDEVLDKLQELTNTLKKNRNYYKDNTLQEMLKKINNLISISNLDKPVLIKKEINNLIPQFTTSLTPISSQIITLATPISFICDKILPSPQQFQQFIKIAPKPEGRKSTTPQIVYISNTSDNK